MGLLGWGELWLGSQENTHLSSRIISRGCQGTFSPGRHTSRNLLETAEGFDADSDCGRGRTEQGHLQKSLKRSGAISAYRTVSCISFPRYCCGPRAFIGELELQASVEPFVGPTQQELYAKTLPKCRLESAMNSMLAHRKNSVCHKSC